MIQAISKFNHKSWKEDSNLSSTTFKKINIIFGHNGSGKSSLAYGLYKECEKTGESKESVRAFGSHYLTSTLLLEDKAGIRGVVSNFGEKNVEIEGKMSVNHRRIAELEAEIITLNKECGVIVDLTESSIKEIVARRKDKNKKINNKPQEKSIEEKVNLWISDYQHAVKVFPTEDYNQITGAIDYSTKNEQIQNIKLSDPTVFADDFIAQLRAILEKEYKDDDAPNAPMMRWLQEGLQLHNGKDSCEFCGGTINIETLTESIKLLSENERQKAVVKLENFQRMLSETAEKAQKVIDNQVIYIDLLNLDASDFLGLSVALSGLQQTVKQIIEDKLNHMSKVFSISQSLDDHLSLINGILTKLKQSKVRSSNEAIEKINRLETLVKGAIGFETKNNSTINQNIKKITQLKKDLKTLNNEVKVLIGKNELLATQRSDLSDFILYLNNVLADLNLNFKLELHQEYYILKHIDGTELKLSDISDGERNLLALIYFYYEMLEDSSGVFRNSVRVVIIDDPISSLDDGNKFYITELVKTILRQERAQVFILTHSWDDFCNFIYGIDREHVSTYEISKAGGISSITCMDGTKVIKPYKSLYKEVFAFSEKNIDSISSEDVLHMPNTMRRVLEEYIKFIADIDLATASKTNDISKALLGKEPSVLTMSERSSLNKLLLICNILSHKANQPRNGAEVLSSAKFLMKSISLHNKYHHIKMIGN